MNSKNVLLLVLWTVLIATVPISLVNGQFSPQTIEFLGSSSENPGEGYRLRNSQPSLPSFVQSSKKLCILGGWALYNQRDFGEGNVESRDLDVTVALTNRGSADCEDSTAVQDILKRTFSVRALGQSGFELYKYKNFIATSDSSILRFQDLPRLTPQFFASQAYNSFVIAEVPIPQQTLMTWYIVCGQNSFCICVREGNNPLVVRDVTQFPKGNPLMRLSSITSVFPGDLACLALSNPAI